MAVLLVAERRASMRSARGKGAPDGNVGHLERSGHGSQGQALRQQSARLPHVDLMPAGAPETSALGLGPPDPGYHALAD
jgi:hypothetical protein